METILDPLFEIFPGLQQFGFGALVPLVAFAAVGILAQWSLYDKCGLPGIDCIIPIKNVITFLKIMGRPASHSLIVMIPPPIIAGALVLIADPTISYAAAAVIGLPWLYFMIKIYIELSQSFGHYKLTDYILVTLFNGFYVLHLGLSHSEKYRGPVYAQKLDKDSEEQLNGQLA
ncbi:MAG: hypothetical protein HOH53_05770 [Flavobacteriales bacterium]|nr:hypothetical protein [Flavobacteriales bacterium]